MNLAHVASPHAEVGDPGRDDTVDHQLEARRKDRGGIVPGAAELCENRGPFHDIWRQFK